MDKFDRADKRWRIVNDWMIRQIEGGEWAAESKLPSIRSLARLFETSITTVQRALTDLQANAYVFTVPRVGYFVSATAQTKPASGFDFSSVSVNVNHAVVTMLSQAASRATASLSSAVLHSDLTPHVLLNKCLSAVAAKADNALTGLVAPPGLPALRRRIAGLMLARGVVCGPDDILVTSGDTVALELALEAIAPRGSTVAIETPTYYGILQTIERLGMRALPIRTHGKLGIDVDHLEEALKQKKVAAIFLNPTLQNPRGFIMPDETRARLSRVARAADVPIIEDDIFSIWCRKGIARAPSRVTTPAARRFTVRHSPRRWPRVIAWAGVSPESTAMRFLRKCFPATWRSRVSRNMYSVSSSAAGTWKNTAPGSGHNCPRSPAFLKHGFDRIFPSARSTFLHAEVSSTGSNCQNKRTYRRWNVWRASEVAMSPAVGSFSPTDIPPPDSEYAWGQRCRRQSCRA